MRDYTQGGYVDINSDLAIGRNNGYVDGLNGAINKFNLDEDIVVYRGTKAKYYDGLEVGDTFNGKVFYSTSLTKDQAVAFVNDINQYDDNGDKGILLDIRAPKGSKGIYIGENTDYKDGNYTINEKEMLLSNTVDYVVKNIEEDKIILEVLV